MASLVVLPVLCGVVEREGGLLGKEATILIVYFGMISVTRTTSRQMILDTMRELAMPALPSSMVSESQLASFSAHIP